jgi:hypothetical protein
MTFFLFYHDMGREGLFRWSGISIFEKTPFVFDNFVCGGDNSVRSGDKVPQDGDNELLHLRISS